MKTVIIIPARFNSSRYPGKPLVNILGKPLIKWVAELSSIAVGKENVYIATDDSRIQKAVISMGYQVVMTSDKHLTGTDRIAEVAEIVDADIYINVQGDEPLVDPKDIERIIKEKIENPNFVINGYSLIDKEDIENIEDMNIPKVIFNQENRLIYMSRKSLPGFKVASNSPLKHYKQVCIYAFSKKELVDFNKFGGKSILEASEDIEIIRFLEWNQPIKMVEIINKTVAVDLPEDVSRVEIAIKEKVK